MREYRRQTQSLKEIGRPTEQIMAVQVQLGTINQPSLWPNVAAVKHKQSTLHSHSTLGLCIGLASAWRARAQEQAQLVCRIFCRYEGRVDRLGESVEDF